jgi:broad specificity phosphatase PhoE
VIMHLARHAEAFKNVAQSHGGPGTALTPLGHQQAEQLAREAKGLGLTQVLAVRRTQCIETAEVVGSMLSLPVTISDDLHPYHLGIAEGVSQEQLMLIAPDVAARIRAWRDGEIEVNRLDIPGGDDPYIYYSHGLAFLDKLHRFDCSLLVATRSVLVLLWNIFAGNHPRPGGGYREVPWQNAELRQGRLDSED